MPTLTIHIGGGGTQYVPPGGGPTTSDFDQPAQAFAGSAGLW